MIWLQQKPDWCLYQDCAFKRRVMDSICGGILPEIQEHEGDYNTFRVCLKTEADILDYQMNKTDLDWLRWVFDALDGKKTSWLSRDG